MAVLHRGRGRIDLDDLPAALAPDHAPSANHRRTLPAGVRLSLPEGGLDLRTLLARVERDMISQALQRTGGNKSQAARLLGLNRTTLVEKLRRSASSKS